MRTLNDYFLHAEIEDISTASSTFVAVPDGGKIIKIITINKMILLNRIKKLLVKLEVYFKVLIPVVKSLVIIAISYSSPNAV